MTFSSCAGVLAALVAGGVAIAAGCSSDAAGAGGAATDGGGSSSGTSGSSGSSSGTSGASGDAASEAGADGGTGGETACDPSAMDCVAGEICTAIGRPAGVCRASCGAEADCTPPSTSCVFLAGGDGACVATCAPFGTDCPAGFTCTAHAADAPGAMGVAQTSHLAFCRKAGATALGASCVDDPSACVAGTDCHYFPDNGEGIPQSKCHALCDAAHTCGAGNCIILDGEGFGFCDG